MRFIKILLSLLLVHFIMTGCGYKPTSYYAKKSISGKVYVNVKIDIDNSQYASIVKSSINELILNRFNANLTRNSSSADSTLFITLSDISHTALQTDAEGYTKLYRTNVELIAKYREKRSKKGIQTIKLSNFHDFFMEQNSIVTEEKKEEAIRIAVNNLLSDLLEKIAVSNIK